MGILGLAIAPVLELLMQATLRHYQQQGSAELATDTRMLLWWPWLMAAIGAYFLIQALRDALAEASEPARQQPMQRQPPRRLAPAPRGQRQTLQDPYRQACALLGVPPGSSWAEIRACWRRQLIHWHPDHGGDAELWHQRVQAYEQLKARAENSPNALVS